jgi:hypothetical protein
VPKADMTSFCGFILPTINLTTAVALGSTTGSQWNRAARLHKKQQPTR